MADPIIALQTFVELFDSSEIVRLETLASTTFYGFARERTISPADPLSNIWRASISGDEIELLTASGQFDQKWNDRASLFAAPPFNDAKSTLTDGVNDHILIGNVSLLNFDIADPFTICGFFRTSQTAEKIILSKQGSSNTAGWRVNTQNNQLRFHLSAGAAGNRLELRLSTETTADDDWHHFVWIYDGSGDATGVSCVYDGVDVTSSLTSNGSATITGATTSSVAAQLSGRNGTVAEFEGFLNEIGIFNVEATIVEAQAMSQAGSVALRKALDLNQHTLAVNLICWYRFDNDVFPNILDRSDVGNALDAIMINMTASDLVSEVPI